MREHWLLANALEAKSAQNKRSLLQNAQIQLTDCNKRLRSVKTSLTDRQYLSKAMYTYYSCRKR